MDEDKWANLKARLDDIEWPEIYMFKFIGPNDQRKLALLEKLFNHDTSKNSYKKSRNGKYVSFTATELMISGEAVIERYKKAGEIEGLIAL